MKSLRPVLACVAPAVLFGLIPAAREPFLYDRTAILDGEWWRLWTGHWVHFSAPHLAWNVFVVLVAGTWLERAQPGSLLRYVAIAAPLLGGAFLAGVPGMQAYGGLSGLATGVVVLLALVQLGKDRAACAWWLGVLACVAIKLGLDATRPAPLFASFGEQDVRVSIFAHAAGALAATIFFLSYRPASPDALQRTAAGHPCR